VAKKLASPWVLEKKKKIWIGMAKKLASPLGLGKIFKRKKKEANANGTASSSSSPSPSSLFLSRPFF
jgi:hypothetical protein